MSDTRRTATPHLPRRPIWLCRACVQEWPCPTARTDLVTEYVDDTVALYVYLAGMLFDAITDLHRLNPEPGPDPTRMYDRFLGWPASHLAIVRHTRRAENDR
jgi:hypothetical protein